VVLKVFPNKIFPGECLIDDVPFQGMAKHCDLPVPKDCQDEQNKEWPCLPNTVFIEKINQNHLNIRNAKINRKQTTRKELGRKRKYVGFAWLAICANMMSYPMK
jgi:hypothetical protein